jgi:hypothetical protein
MLRKQILGRPASAAPQSGEIDIVAGATVMVTSEAAEYPIENAFDSRRGPGGGAVGSPGRRAPRP